MVLVFQRLENVAMRVNKPLQPLEPRLKQYQTFPAQTKLSLVLTPKNSRRLSQTLRLPAQAHRYVL